MNESEVKAKMRETMNVQLQSFVTLRETLSKAIADGRGTPEMAAALNIACEQERLLYLSINAPDQLLPR